MRQNEIEEDSDKSRLRSLCSWGPLGALGLPLTTSRPIPVRGCLWATEELESGRWGKPEVEEAEERVGREGGREGARAPVSHLFSLASLSFLDFCVCH